MVIVADAFTGEPAILFDVLVHATLATDYASNWEVLNRALVKPWFLAASGEELEWMPTVTSALRVEDLGVDVFAFPGDEAVAAHVVVTSLVARVAANFSLYKLAAAQIASTSASRGVPGSVVFTNLVESGLVVLDSVILVAL